MLNTEHFGDLLKSYGYTFASGVPCSFLKYLINHAINDMDYVGAANEGDAVAISAGAYLSGRKSMVLMQNSGLTNAVSPLTSLNYPFRLPVLGFVSLRGEAGLNDEPQHELTGTVTDQMLDVCGVAHDILSSDMARATEQLIRANTIIEENRSFFFIVRKNTFSQVDLADRKPTAFGQGGLERSTASLQEMTRLSALEVISGLRDEKTVCLASTGKGGRELYEIGDVPNNLYMVGSMGCISSLGLGLARNRSDLRVVAIDGDGALLMRMGSLATNAYYGTANLLHILLDNNCHDSTGGQQTVSHNVDFPAIAHACGYPQSIEIHTLDELEDRIRAWKRDPVLTFMHVRVKKGSKPNLGRPAITPKAVKERLMGFIRTAGMHT